MSARDLDPRLLNPPDVPPGWEIPPELAERFWPGKIIFTPDELAERDRLLATRFFLLTNETQARCRVCNAVHPYFTTRCIERPFHGLKQILALEAVLADDIQARHGNVPLFERALAVTRPGSIVPIRPREAQVLLLRIAAKGGVDPVELGIR